MLLTGAFSYTPEEIRRIGALGYRVDFQQYETETVADPEKYTCTVCNGLFLHNPIHKFTNLQMLQLISAGTDRVPLDFVRTHGIRLFRAEGVYHIPMAEWAVLKVLEFYKESHFFYGQQQKRRWEKRRDLLELAGKKICIVGMGNVGKAAARRFRAFDAEITGLDIVPVACNDADRILHIDHLGETVGKSDVVILSVPYTPKTHHLIDGQILRAFPKHAVIVNLSRGHVIDEAALIVQLQKKALLGAALDVFAEEPLPPESPLWDLENVIITPHNAFVSDQTRKRLYARIYQNLAGFLEGHPEKEQGTCEGNL